MLNPRVWLFVVGLITATGLSSSVYAQGYFNQPSGTGSSKNSGSSSMFNSGSTGSTGMGTTGFGSTGMGANSMGMGATNGFGQNSTGFGATNQSGFGTGQQGQNGFLGANNNPNSFLGRNTQGQNANQSGANQTGQRNNRGQRGQNQNIQNLLNGNGNGQFGGTNNTQNTKTNTVHPRQKVAFDHPTVQTASVVTGITGRFEKLSKRFPYLKGVELTAGDEGVVVLRGSVDSENAAKVTESLVRLEPGVKVVQNQLTYPPPAVAE